MLFMHQDKNGGLEKTMTIRKHSATVVAAALLTASVATPAFAQQDPYGGNPTPATPTTTGGSNPTKPGAPGRVTTRGSRPVTPRAPGRIQTGAGGMAPVAGTQKVVTGIVGRPASTNRTTSGATGTVTQLPATGGGVPEGDLGGPGLLLAAALAMLGAVTRRLSFRA
jgi:hypothetical protein